MSETRSSAKSRIADIAREARVGTATVDRVLDDRKSVGRPTAERVLDVARRLNYPLAPQLVGDAGGDQSEFRFPIACGATSLLQDGWRGAGDRRGAVSKVQRDRNAP
jgi:hypothetical protein